LALMLHNDFTLSPSAMYLLEEFSHNFQITCTQPHHNVQIHQDFNETPQSKQSPRTSDGFMSPMQGNNPNAFEGASIMSVIDINFLSSDDRGIEPSFEPVF